MSAIGPKRTLALAPRMSAIGGKANIVMGTAKPGAGYGKVLRIAWRRVARDEMTCHNGRQPACHNGLMDMGQVLEMIGAGEGNRTLVISLEGCCSTIELHPRTFTAGALISLSRERRSNCLP